MASKIFISYRRDDSAGTAGRLRDWLAGPFGDESLFMDVDNIPAGADFAKYLNDQVANCDIFLCTIGPNWLNARDDDGKRRLDQTDDYVRVEIAAALSRDISIVPVLIDGARVPKARELPDEIAPFTRRQAAEVRNSHFRRDADELTHKSPLRAEWMVRLVAPATSSELGRNGRRGGRRVPDGCGSNFRF